MRKKKRNRHKVVASSIYSSMEEGCSKYWNMSNGLREMEGPKKPKRKIYSCPLFILWLPYCTSRWKSSQVGVPADACIWCRQASTVWEYREGKYRSMMPWNMDEMGSFLPLYDEKSSQIIQRSCWKRRYSLLCKVTVSGDFWLQANITIGERKWRVWYSGK